MTKVITGLLQRSEFAACVPVKRLGKVSFHWQRVEPLAR